MERVYCTENGNELSARSVELDFRRGGDGGRGVGGRGGGGRGVCEIDRPIRRPDRPVTGLDRN